MLRLPPAANVRQSPNREETSTSGLDLGRHHLGFPVSFPNDVDCDYHRPNGHVHVYALPWAFALIAT